MADQQQQQLFALQQQIEAGLASMQAEGLLDEQFQQLLALQDESNPDFVREVAELYFDDGAPKIARVAQLLAAPSVDFPELDAVVHQFKGSSASLGAGGMARVCIRMRELATARDVAGCQALVGEVRSCAFLLLLSTAFFVVVVVGGRPAVWRPALQSWSSDGPCSDLAVAAVVLGSAVAWFEHGARRQRKRGAAAAPQTQHGTATTEAAMHRTPTPPQPPNTMYTTPTRADVDRWSSSSCAFGSSSARTFNLRRSASSSRAAGERRGRGDAGDAASLRGAAPVF